MDLLKSGYTDYIVSILTTEHIDFIDQTLPSYKTRLFRVVTRPDHKSVTVAVSPNGVAFNQVLLLIQKQECPIPHQEANDIPKMHGNKLVLIIVGSVVVAE